MKCLLLMGGLLLAASCAQPDQSKSQSGSQSESQSGSQSGAQSGSQSGSPMPTQAQQAKADAEERASFPYRGPRVDAELRQTERGAVVVVQVAAPRPGYRLELQETRLGNEGPEALLTLTEPAATDDAAKESGVATAPVVQRFPVPALNPVRVLVRQVQVGVHYIVDPPHELAVIAR